jgi:Flp pilus assembly protein TadD
LKISSQGKLEWLSECYFLHLISAPLRPFSIPIAKFPITFPIAHEELARVHAARGQRPLVLQAWHRAAEAIPESARARHGVGAALLELDRDADARPWLEQAFAMDNNDVELAVDYARLLARGGQRDTARNLLDQVLALSPGHPRAAAARRAIQAGQRP